MMARNAGRVGSRRIPMTMNPIKPKTLRTVACDPLWGFLSTGMIVSPASKPVLCSPTLPDSVRVRGGRIAATHNGRWILRVLSGRLSVAWSRDRSVRNLVPSRGCWSRDIPTERWHVLEGGPSSPHWPRTKLRRQQLLRHRHRRPCRAGSQQSRDTRDGTRDREALCGRMRPRQRELAQQEGDRVRMIPTGQLPPLACLHSGWHREPWRSLQRGHRRSTRPAITPCPPAIP